MTLSSLHILTVAGLVVAAAPAAQPVKVERNSATLQFTYAWPAQAAAIPRLDRRFRSDLDKSWRSARATVRSEQQLTREQKRPFNPQFFSSVWTSVGETRRLLSLQGELGEFTGGAHPNSGSFALLWDRALAREITTSALFVQPSAFAGATRAAYCTALDAERIKKREGATLEGEFNDCPKYSELAIAPVDRNHDGKFDAIAFVASPYVAGPYVEGEYDITLPVTKKLISALKAPYRASFATQPQ